MDQFVTISNDSFNHGPDEGEERERETLRTYARRGRKVTADLFGLTRNPDFLFCLVVTWQRRGFRVR